MKPFAITVNNRGPAAEHNMPCPQCLERKAVLNMSRGLFQPCWECQGKGWRLVKLPRFLARCMR